MQILISPAAVAFRRVIGTDDVLVLVIDVFLLVPVSVFVVVGGRGIHHTGGGLPVFVTVGQAEKLVERVKGKLKISSDNINVSTTAIASISNMPFRSPMISLTFKTRNIKYKIV